MNRFGTETLEQVKRAHHTGKTWIGAEGIEAAERKAWDREVWGGAPPTHVEPPSCFRQCRVSRSGKHSSSSCQERYDAWLEKRRAALLKEVKRTGFAEPETGHTWMHPCGAQMVLL